MPSNKHYEKRKCEQELIKYITDKGISYKVALDVLKRHFEPTQIQILYPGHNPGGLY